MLSVAHDEQGTLHDRHGQRQGRPIRVIYLPAPSGAIVSACLVRDGTAANAAPVVAENGMICSADSARIRAAGTDIRWFGLDDVWRTRAAGDAA